MNRYRGIDLLKGIAIIMIFFYHLSSKWLPGGFLGVDLFLVISGFLIVTSLVKSYEENKKINFFPFIFKRLKKLVPALYVMVSAVLIYLVLFNKPLLEISNLDAVSGYTFTSNIWFIVKKVDYFAAFGNPSPYKHLWYLGLVFQFYLIITLLAKMLMGKKTKNNKDIFLFAMVGLAIVSFARMVIVFDINDISRAYYGTDTRLFEPIIGAIGGYWYSQKSEQINSFFARNKNFVNLGLLLLPIFIGLTFIISEYSFWLYKGGFLLFDLLSLYFIFSVGMGLNKKLARIFSSNIILIGKISYSLYLWHFPIIILTRLNSEVVDINLFMAALRLVASLLVGLASFYYFELNKAFARKKLDIKKMSSRQKARYLREQREKESFKRVALSLAGVLLIMGILGIGFPLISTAFVNEQKENVVEDEFITGDITANEDNASDENPEETNSEGKDNQNEQNNVAEPTEDPQVEEPQVEEEQTEDQTEQAAQETETKDYKFKSIVLIGDSLGVNVGPAIKEEFENTIADAKISRQLYKSVPIAEKYKNHDSSDNVVIFMLGTNGIFSEEQMEDLIEVFPLSQKYFVNVKMPENFQDLVNSTLESTAAKHDDVHIIDWKSVAISNPEYLEPDKTHLNYKGVEAIRKIIFDAINK